MQPAITRDQLKQLLDHDTPFVIELSEGRQYVVSSRFSLALGTNRAVVVDADGLPHIFAIDSISDIRHLKNSLREQE